MNSDHITATPPDTNRRRRTVRPRERLERAADALFERGSIRSVSVDALAHEASVPKSGFYRHFASKEDLILDYVERASTRFRRRLETIGANEAAAGDRLLSLLELEDDNARLLRAGVEYPDPDSSISFVILRHRQWVRQWIANELDVVHGLDGPLIALELATLLDAFALEGTHTTEYEQIQTVYLRRVQDVTAPE